MKTISTAGKSTGQNASRNLAGEEVRASLAEITRVLARKPFRPHPLFANGHAQTIAAYAWPRRYKMRTLRADRERLFEVEPGVRLLAHCRWHPERGAHPTLVLVHGLEGSSTSVYLLGTAAKAFGAGFNVLRLNMRNCGGTEHLAPTLYNSGLSGDLRAVVKELIERDRLQDIFLVGFSMSGNMALKFVGEDGDRAPRELRGVCAVSPSVDLGVCAEAINRRANWVYQRRFLSSLRRRMHTKQKLYPELFDAREIHLVRTIRDFDEQFTAKDGGFSGADDYYTRSSSLALIRHIRTPTLIVHAEDDPFIPFSPLRDPHVAENPYILLLAPRHGGHVGFLAADAKGEDRFWAENRIIEFCKLVYERIER